MRTGLLDGPTEAEEDLTVKVVALLRIFAKESVVVAATYVKLKNRREVNEDDMRKGLKYCARMFFQKEEEELKRLMDEEIQMMMEEEDDEEEEGEEEEDEEEEGEEEEGEEEEINDPSLATKVDKIDEVWDLWSPTDELHRLLKHAIDKTTPP